LGWEGILALERAKIYFERIDAWREQARGLSADTLLLVIISAAAIIVLLLTAWRKAARRARLISRDFAVMEAELASSKRALEEEVKWRLAAEKRGAQAPKPTIFDATPSG
jgi:hypothetical protein